MLVTLGAVAVAVKCPKCQAELVAQPDGQVARRRSDDAGFDSLPPAATVQAAPRRAKGFANRPAPPPPPASPPVTEVDRDGRRVYRPIRPATARRTDTAKTIRTIAAILVAVTSATIVVVTAAMYGPALIEQSGLDAKIADIIPIDRPIPPEQTRAMIDRRQVVFRRLTADLSDVLATPDLPIPQTVQRDLNQRFRDNVADAKTFDQIYRTAAMNLSAWRSFQRDLIQYAGEDPPALPDQWRDRYAELHQAAEVYFEHWQTVLVETARCLEPMPEGPAWVGEALEIDKSIRRRYVVAKSESFRHMRSRSATAASVSSLRKDNAALSDQLWSTAIDRYRELSDRLSDPPDRSDDDAVDPDKLLRTRYLDRPVLEFLSRGGDRSMDDLIELRNFVWNR